MSSAREFDKNKSQPWVQNTFESGMVKNAPHDDIPQNSVAYIRNAHCYPTECQPRLGSRLYSLLQPPAMDGRTGYAGSKSGNIITANANFIERDVSTYWVWPDEDVHDEIVGYISSTQVRVRDSGTKELTSGCWMHGRLNLFKFHYSEKKVVFQWGTEVYVADSIALNFLVKVVCVSREQPANVISDWGEEDKQGVIFNSRGIFVINFYTSPPTLFKRNTPIPAQFPDEVQRSDATKYRYDVTYALARLDGHSLRDRTTEGARILQQSGPLKLNETLETPRDYSMVWTEKRIGTGEKKGGMLTGGALARSPSRPEFWHAISNGTFTLTINDKATSFICDFSFGVGSGISSLSDVARVLQVIIRTSFMFATCEFVEDHFVITTGEENGATIGYAEDGSDGTPVAASLGLTVGQDATIDNAYVFAQPYVFGPVYIPVNSIGLREWHWTHYVLFRTNDIGRFGVTPRVSINGDILPPLKFTYSEEVRVAGAFYASRSNRGVVTAQQGTFEKFDVGTAIKWEDGEIDTIERFINARSVSVGSGYYYAPKSLQAAVIGHGRVIRASQSGAIVTRVSGGVFSADDLRKTITWSSDYYSIIKRYISTTSVEVYDTIDKDLQCATLDPQYRHIADYNDDQMLRNRQGEKHIGLLPNRFWTNMPNVNIGRIAPGFMVTAIKNYSEVYYCQLSTALKYLGGYYLENRQKSDTVENAIQAIWVLPNKVIVFCKGSTWGGPTNIPDIKKLPEFGEVYAVLHFDIIDPNNGVVDSGSIQPIGDGGLLEMKCSDGSWRQFDGYKFSEDFAVDPNTAQDRVKHDLITIWQLGSSIYSNKTGHIHWGKIR